jgi:uncharacterized metal-binding protein YceD (DUF177 family)
MANPLLDSASPRDLAACSQVIETKGKVSDFGRLVEIIEADLADSAAESHTMEWRDSPVEIKLLFGWSDEVRDVPALSGKVAAGIAAICQRCLEPFAFPLETELAMLLPNSAAATKETGGTEVWDVVEDTVRPLDIVEESLIMALPLAPMHEPIDLCGSLLADLRGELSEEPTGTDRPFANLRAEMDESN